MNWTEPKPLTGFIHCDHTSLETPLGKFIIAWKRWKETPSYDIILNGCCIGECECLETAKNKAIDYIGEKYNELGRFLSCDFKMYAKHILKQTDCYPDICSKQ